MCAKVTGPLFSLDARNAIGKAIVYSYWKGVNYVRTRVIPKNPKEDLQAEVRTYLGCAGSNNREIQRATALKPNEALLLTQIKEVTPGDQSWSSYFAKTQIGSGLSAIKQALLDFADPAKYFEDAAALIPLTGFNVGYGEVDPITGAQQLFISARAAFALGLDLAPVDPLEMSEAQVVAFGAAYKATA